MSKLKVMYEGILDLANCKIPYNKRDTIKDVSFFLPI